MKRISMAILGALCALFISGCASNSDYYKAVLAIESAREEADKAKWEAVKAGMAKASPEGAAMAAMAIALGGRASDSPRAQLQAPRDGWDYFIQGVSAFGTLTQAVGGVIVPVRLAQESRKTSEAMYASTALIEQSRGATQTAINASTVAGLRDLGIAAANSPRGAITTNNTTNTLSGSGVIGNGTYNPVTTTTTITGSYNPTNPPGKTCTPTYSATGTPTGFVCS